MIFCANQPNIEILSSNSTMQISVPQWGFNSILSYIRRIFVSRILYCTRTCGTFVQALYRENKKIPKYVSCATSYCFVSNPLSANEINGQKINNTNPIFCILYPPNGILRYRDWYLVPDFRQRVSRKRWAHGPWKRTLKVIPELSFVTQRV